LTSIAAGPAGFVAVSGWRGCCGPQTPATILFSTDGLAWRPVSVAEPGGAALNAVAATQTGFVVVGQRPPAGLGGQIHPTVWSSSDGVHWTEADLPPLAAGTPLAAIAVSDSPWGPTVAGLAGTSGSGNPQGIVLWNSPDGVSWGDPEPVTDAPNADALALAAGPNRLTMAIGLAEAPGTTWSTIDGTDWWPDDAVPQIHGPALALDEHDVVLVSNCAAYLSDCPGPALFTGTFDPAPAH